MKKREINKTIILEPAKTRLKKNQCPSCGLPKSKWKRRKDWRCCSVECTSKFYNYLISYCWADIREKALKRDNFTCVKCGDNRKETEVSIMRKNWINRDEMFLGKEKKPRYKKEYMKQVKNNLIGDHIIPIALGGDEFDLKNIQTLCLACNKIKTSKDLKDISLERKRERIKTPKLK